jgi:pentatricopeptide repeat protein
MRSEEFVADVVTYNTLIRHLSLSGKSNEVYLLFHQMLEEGIAHNEITYSLVIDCLCREDKFTVALSCFYRSLQDGFFPSVISSIVRGLIVGGKLDELHTLIGWIRGQGFAIDVYMYQEVIIALCKNGYCQGTDRIAWIILVSAFFQLLFLLLCFLHETFVSKTINAC